MYIQQEYVQYPYYVIHVGAHMCIAHNIIVDVYYNHLVQLSLGACAQEVITILGLCVCASVMSLHTAKCVYTTRWIY